MKLHGQDFDIGDFQIQRLALEPSTVHVVFDVGANVGNTAAAYREFFPGADVYAFEPFAPIFEQLKARFIGDQHVHPFQVAAGRRSETKLLYRNEYADTNSLLPRPSSNRRYYAADNVPLGTEMVEVTSLDDFAVRENVSRINILKLDIQGGEADALAGARILLRDSRIDLIFCEVFFTAHYECGPLFHEITGQLASYGYSLYNLRHLVTGTNGQLRFADAVYVSERVRTNNIDTRPSEP